MALSATNFVTIMEVDESPSALASWQLAKPLTGAQTALTAQQLSSSLRSMTVEDGETVSVLPVASIGKLALQHWGVASDTNAATMDIYVWSETGPGLLLVTVTSAAAGFTSAANTVAAPASAGFHTNAHQNIKDEFAAGTAYRGHDTYSEGSVDYFAATTPPAVADADVPGMYILDFANIQPAYMALVATAVTGTSIGAIFKPLSFKTAMPQTVS